MSSERIKSALIVKGQFDNGCVFFHSSLHGCFLLTDA